MTDANTLIGSGSSDGQVGDEPEFHLAMSESDLQTLDRLLADDRGVHADLVERGAICVISRSSGDRRESYLVRDIVTPQEGDVYIEDRVVRFDDKYRSHALQRAQDTAGGGIMFVHTHPPGAGASPSPKDEDTDRKQLYAAAKHLSPGAPLASAIRADGNGTWNVRQFEFDVERTRGQIRSDEYGKHTEEVTEATAVRVVGRQLNKLGTTTTVAGAAGPTGRIDPDEIDSSLGLFGTEGHRHLAGLRVGLVGCGGVGSILAEHLSRLGIGEIVAIDFDHIEEANFNRHEGATEEDVEKDRLKVEVSKRVAEESATAPDFSFRPVVGSVAESQSQEYAALQTALDCDILVSTADTHHSRAVLDELAYAHLIPVIDGGTVLHLTDGDTLHRRSQCQVTVAGPGHPCLECAGVWNHSGLGEELTKPQSRGYVDQEGEQSDDGDRALSVIDTNALVASVIGQRLKAIALGVAPDLEVGQQVYSPATGVMRWRDEGDSPFEACLSTCDRAETTARGDTHDLSRGKDWALHGHLNEV